MQPKTCRLRPTGQLGQDMKIKVFYSEQKSNDVLDEIKLIVIYSISENRSERAYCSCHCNLKTPKVCRNTKRRIENPTSAPYLLYLIGQTSIALSVEISDT